MFLLNILAKYVMESRHAISIDLICIGSKKSLLLVIQVIVKMETEHCSRMPMFPGPAFAFIDIVDTALFSCNLGFS